MGNVFAKKEPTADPSRGQIDALLALINSSVQDAVAEYEKTGRGAPSTASPVAHPLDANADCVPLRKAIRVLEGACEQLCATLAPPGHTIVNVRAGMLIMSIL